MCRDTKSNEWHAQQGDVNSSHLEKRLCRNVHISRPGFVSRAGLAALSTTLPDLLDSLLLHTSRRIGRSGAGRGEPRPCPAEIEEGALTIVWGLTQECQNACRDRLLQQPRRERERARRSQTCLSSYRPSEQCRHAARRPREQKSHCGQFPSKRRCSWRRSESQGPVVALDAGERP